MGEKGELEKRRREAGRHEVEQQIPSAGGSFSRRPNGRWNMTQSVPGEFSHY